MNIQSIPFTDEKTWLEERKKDITSTEISALFGISPYMTKFELWHRKKNNIEVDFEMNDRVQWGMRLQDAIAAGVAEDNHWQIKRMDEYIRIPELRIGASFDFSIEQNAPTPIPVNFNLEPGKVYYAPPFDGTVGVGLLEIKNVDSLIAKNKWIIDGDNVEAPPHIEIQAQHQMLVSGRSFCYIAALVGGNRVILIKREPDQDIFEAIKKEVALFWKSIDENKAPEPDFTKDAKVISKLHQFSEPGSIYNAEGDNEIFTLAKRYKELGTAIKSCDDEREGIKSQILMKIGDAEKVLGDGFSISASTVGPAHVEYERQGYRGFRIFWRKEK